MSQPVPVVCPAQLRYPRARARGRVALSSAAVLALVAGVLGTPASPLAGVPAAAASAGPRVRVDPASCTAPQPADGVTVVCTPAEAAPRLASGGTLVLAPGLHAGPLDLRSRSGLRVQGEPGAVLDAGEARYALSLRDVASAEVEGLVLRGGTAQTVWLERVADVTLRAVTVEGGAGVGVHLRDAVRTVVADAEVTGAASAGIMELSGVTDSTYERLLVAGNGRGPASYNGDGLQLAGTGVAVRDVVTRDNGSSDLYEHGIYVSAVARAVSLVRVDASGNAGVAVKLGGSGTLADSVLRDDRLALYCGTTAAGGWAVRGTVLDAPRATAGGPGCTVGT